MNFKPVTPIGAFKYFCLTSYPFIENDFDALTNYELLCKIVGYINAMGNAVDDVISNTIELNKAFIELKNYIDNLDLQEEVNNKLDEMIAAGTLGNIMLSAIPKNIYFDLYKPYLSNDEKITDILTHYDNTTIIFNNDVEFKKDINIAGNINLISNVNSTIKANNITFTYPQTENYIDCTVTNGIIKSSIAPNYNIGDMVRLYADISDSNNMSLVFFISDINGNLITPDIDISLFNNLSPLKIGKIEYTYKNYINGINFEINNLLNIKRCYVTLDNCSVKNCNFGTSTYGYVDILNSYFTNLQHFDVWNCNNINIINNKLDNSYHFIRLYQSALCTIENNYLNNGLNKNYTMGIDIYCPTTAIENSTNIKRFKYTKSYNNKIINNILNDINHGVVGSGLGGIHVNFGANNNIIKGNKIYKCGIGIYLENNGYDNIIDGNTIENSYYYYAEGIDLDWDAHHNIVVNNIIKNCFSEVVTDVLTENSGICIRNGSEHSCDYNIICNNIVENIGGVGIWASGSNNNISNNTLINCGQSYRNNDYLWNTFIKVNELHYSTIKGNNINRSKVYNTSALLITDSDNLIISDNIFNVAYVDSAKIIGNIIIRHSEYIKFINNLAKSQNTRLIIVNQSSDTTKYKCVLIQNNIFNGDTTLTPAIASCNGYSIKDNIINNSNANVITAVNCENSFD